MASNPGWPFGFIPTAAEWNGEFGLKADESEIVAWLPNYAGLRANTLFTAPLFLKGAATDRDGGEGIYVWNSTDTTTPDNGGTVIIDASGRRWFRSYSSEGVDIRWFGARGDGVTDNTGAIQAAVNTGLTVFIPIGNFLVNNPITCSVPGQKIYGSDRLKSLIYINPTFNMGAIAVFVVTTGEPGPVFQNFGVYYTRVGNPNDLTAYPPTFSAITCPRTMWRYIRVVCATTCIDMRGNSGGSNIIECEFSFLARGVRLDGSLDTVRVSKCHFWPFGMNENTPLTGAQLDAMQASAFGIHSGRMDDLAIDNTLFFNLYGLVTYWGDFLPDFPGPTGAILNGVAFDTNGGINQTAGNITCAGCTFSAGTSWSQPIAVIAGSGPTQTATMVLSGCLFFTPGFQNPPGAVVNILGNGNFAHVTITGCFFDLSFNLTGYSAIAAGDYSQVSLTGNRFQVDGQTSRALPVIDLSGTVGSQYCVVGNVVAPSPQGGATGNALLVATDFSNIISGNDFSGWNVSLPIGHINTNVGGNVGLVSGLSQNVTSGRALGAQEVNLRAQSAMVNVSVSSPVACVINAFINGIVVATQTFNNAWGSLAFVVPSGARFAVTTDTGTLQLWTEQAI